MKSITVLAIIAGVAVARLTAIAVSASLVFLVKKEWWLALYYYPAGVIDVIALIVFGYWAAVGAGLACVAWNVWHFDLSWFDIAIMLMAAIARGVVTLWIFARLFARPRGAVWVIPTLTSVFFFSVVFGVVAAGCSLFVLANVTPAQTLTEGEMASLFSGTVAGSFGGFLVLNLLFSAYLSTRLKSG